MGRRGAALLLVVALLGCAQAALRSRMTTQDGPMLPPARAHCRVFVVAAQTHTRVMVLQNAYEQDAINVYDQFPALTTVLQDTQDLGPADAKSEKERAGEAYEILQPAFTQAADWLKDRVDPARCFAHFIMADSEIPSDSRTQDEAATAISRINRRIDQLKDRARADRHFPFALNAPSVKHRDDKDSVTSSGDLRVVPAPWRRYFHVVGINYFSGRVAPSLSPGQVEVFGLLHVDAGGRAGKMSSESDSDWAEMVFDVRERWRRSKRQRQVNVALNTSDFYGREYPGFGRNQVQHAVIKLKQKKNRKGDSDALQHPCYFRGHDAVVEGANVTLEGTGDADKCMSLLRSYVASSNANCPPENFCFLGGVPQPQGAGSFYASGVLREAVLSASRVLEYASNKFEEKEVDQLQLPTPTLPSLRSAAKYLCALPYKDIAIGAALPPVSVDELSSQTATKSSSELPSALCFDLCYTIVLLEQIGVQDDDERIHFVSRFEKQPVLSGHGSVDNKEQGGPFQLVAWLTGAFLYLEALQRKVTFSIESELLAEQLSAGLPFGWNMSLMVFVAACVFLYLSTGRAVVSGRTGRSSGGYHRVVNGGAKAKYKDTTQSIMFVDDARE
ncbi:hypothetical protein V7S43_016569 [Phytophthora oleae]|uniref:Uncharacterized protein n=1 Tax=Phytophthora oleae TaxID=2107226 RepID=A0ABD3EYL8_9STRA